MGSENPESESKKGFFPALDAEDGEGVTEIQSLCMNCQEQGSTRLLFTRIPYFKEVIISSFSCDECGYENREVQFGGRIQDKGVHIILTVKTKEDLNRQVVKSDMATFSIPEVELEQPSSGKGDINTVEGLVTGVIDGLMQDQPVRKAMDPDAATKIEEFVGRLEKLKELEEPFSIVLDDPTGNSYVENLLAPKADPQIHTSHYTRTAKQNVELRINPEPGMEEASEAVTADADKEFDVTGEVLTFPGHCPSCQAPCDTNMKSVKIPYFKEVVIMATNCDQCGLKENEVKGGSGISDKGTKITLRMTSIRDLSRDVLKSDTCGVKIPDLDLELEHGTLGGKFTTLEGLLTNIRDQLSEVNPFMAGDSSEQENRQKLDVLCDKLNQIIEGKMLGITVIMDDPAGNSYLQNPCAPEPDPEMKVEHYERTFEQRELLGLNDMKTEDYTDDTPAPDCGTTDS